jgi:hypothetical protein
MIQAIIDLLLETDDNHTEALQTARGKYAYPQSFKEAIKKKKLYGSK